MISPFQTTDFMNPSYREKCEDNTSEIPHSVLKRLYVARGQTVESLKAEREKLKLDIQHLERGNAALRDSLTREIAKGQLPVKKIGVGVIDVSSEFQFNELYWDKKDLFNRWQHTNKELVDMKNSRDNVVATLERVEREKKELEFQLITAKVEGESLCKQFNDQKLTVERKSTIIKNQIEGLKLLNKGYTAIHKDDWILRTRVVEQERKIEALQELSGSRLEVIQQLENRLRDMTFDRNALATKFAEQSVGPNTLDKLVKAVQSYYPRKGAVKIGKSVNDMDAVTVMNGTDPVAMCSAPSFAKAVKGAAELWLGYINTHDSHVQALREAIK